MASGGQRIDGEDGFRRGHRNWLRMLLTQALLLSCLSLRSSAFILPWDPEVRGHCWTDCFPSSSATASLPCNSSVAGKVEHRTCNLTDVKEEFRIIARDAPLWDVLSVINASTVKLDSTKLVKKIFLKDVRSIVIGSSGTQVDGFSYLKLEDCQIGDEYILSFSSLKQLHINSSKIGVINQTSMDEIDIVKGSWIKKLLASLETTKSAFQDSTLDKIEMLHIRGTATIVMKNMTIRDVQNLEYSSSNSSTVRSSYIEKVTSLISRPSEGKFVFNGVEIEEIVPNGMKIMGQVEIINSVIHKSYLNGIVISGSGKITFSNTTVNGVQLSYTLKADPSSNATVNAFHLPMMTFPSLIVCWVIIAVLAAVIVVLLLYFFIKPAVAKRNLNAAEDPKNQNLKSNDPRTVSANYYTKSLASQDIPMTIRNESDTTGHSAMTQSGGPVSQELLTSPDLSASEDYCDVSQLPPPPPQMLSNRANTPQPLYDDIEGGESETKSSFLYSQEKTSVGQKKNGFQSPNAQTSGQASHAVHPEVPLHALKPMLPRPGPNLPAPPPALLVPSHYATRGQVKPPPPPRNPPTHRLAPQPTGGHSLPIVEFQPAPAADMPYYQDTVSEEPLYASEHELMNY